MADFDYAYSHTNKNEGGYANNPKDKGGETMYGIARNYWPNWGGWKYIDEIKTKYGRTAAIINKHAGANQTIQALKKEFYLTNFWYPLNLSLLNDNKLARNVYDFGVNAGTKVSAKRLQTASNAVCGNLVVDGMIGAKTIEQINKLNANAVYNEFNGLRKSFYDNIIANNQSQAVFRNSWYSRIIPYNV